MSSSSHQPDRLLRWLLVWTSVTFLTSWLPLIRGLMEGPAYSWGNSYFGYAFGGRGFTPGSWILVAEIALGFAILFLGWRGARSPVGLLLAGWHGLLAANSTFNSLRSPEDYRFQGDSLGIDVNIAWLGPLALGGAFLLSLRWLWKNRGLATGPVPAWTRANTAWAVGLALLLPVQLLLLRSGEQHGLGDKIGVVLTIAQWLLVPLALKARR